MAGSLSAADAVVLAVAKGEACDLGEIQACDPMADWADRDVPAEVVKSQIVEASTGAQRFSLNGARIVGRLDLRDCEIRAPLVITNCWLEGGIDIGFGNLRDVDFGQNRITSNDEQPAVGAEFVTVAGDIVLGDACIKGCIDLTRATIKGSISAQRLRIEPDLDNPEPDWTISLQAAEVSVDLDLEHCHLHGGISLAGATITGQVNIRGAQLKALSIAPSMTAYQPNDTKAFSVLWAQRCEVGESFLASPADDTPTRCTGYLDFQGAHIAGNLSVRAAELAPAQTARDPNGHSDFGQQRRVISLDLYDAKIDGWLDARAGSFGPTGTEVDLRNCSSSRLSLNEGDWEDVRYGIGGLTYTISNSNKARRRWIDNAADGPHAGGFLALADIALEAGNSSDSLKAKIKASSAAATPLERWTLGLVRYGYRPYLVAIPLLLLGLLTLAQALHAREGTPAFAPVTVGDQSVLPNAACEDSAVRCLQPIVYALDAVLPLDLKQVSTWRPDNDQERGQWLSTLLLIDELAAWVLAGVFVASVGGLLKRT